MDRNSIIGIILIVLTVIVFSIINQPSREELARQQAIRDSIQQARKSEMEKDTIQGTELTVPISNSSYLGDSAFTSSNLYGPFSKAHQKSGQLLRFRNKQLEITFNTRGAQIHEIRLLEYKNYNTTDTLSLFLPGSNIFSIPLSVNNHLIRTEDLTFDLASEENFADTVKIKFSLKTDSLKPVIDFEYLLPPGGYMLGFRITGLNLSHIVPDQPIDLEWKQTVLSQEKDVSNEKGKSTIFYMDISESISEMGTRSKEKEEVDYDLKWIGFSQQFFTTTLISDESLKRPITLLTNPSDENEKNWLRKYEAVIRLPFSGESRELFNAQIFAGPKNYKILKAYDLNLESQINLGWKAFRWINTLFIINIFQWLSSFNLNYGLIIFILTLIVKIALSPITYRMYVSSAKMRILKPDLDLLNEKFPNPEDALKKNQEMMALYRRAGVNPLAGCVPALLQMPLLFAMLSFFPSSIELRQQSFLWADDLSTYDAILTFGYIPLISSIYGNHVSLLAILMTASTILYTMMNNTNLGTGMQAQQMKIMMYIMPVFFLLFLNTQPAALCLYYLIANVISVLQTIVIREFIIDEAKLRARIEENKKRPETKKSKWQLRLEEIQKMQRQRSEELQKRQRRSRR